uniref:NADH dehydrogenase subunit 1 n=1 Tax=Ditylenchus dipsaci TaxID=166011 RepID=A0A915D5S2_9BILA
MSLLVDFAIVFGVPLLLLHGMLPLLVYLVPTFASACLLSEFSLRGIRSVGRDFYLEKDIETSKAPLMSAASGQGLSVAYSSCFILI